MPDHSDPTRHEARRVARADGRELAFRRLGHGPPLVCLAGGPGADAAYLEDLGGLSSSFRLVIADARGTGSSDPPVTDRGYGFDEVATDIEPLREHLGLDRMMLLAHSAACTTALCYAANHPSRIRALILVAPSRWLYPEIEDDTGEILDRRHRERWYSAVMSARARLEAGASPDAVPDLLAAIAPALYARWGAREQEHAARMRPASWDAMRGFWQAEVDGESIRARLSLVRAPVLVVTGELDAATGINPGPAWAACFPDGRHATIAGSGHNPWIDQPDRFVSEVSRFLAAVTV